MLTFSGEGYYWILDIYKNEKETNANDHVNALQRQQSRREKKTRTQKKKTENRNRITKITIRIAQMTHNRKYRLDKNVMPIECRRACVQHTMHAPKLYREPKNGFIEFIGALNVGKKQSKL